MCHAARPVHTTILLNRKARAALCFFFLSLSLALSRDQTLPHYLIHCWSNGPPHSPAFRPPRPCAANHSSLDLLNHVRETSTDPSLAATLETHEWGWLLPQPRNLFTPGSTSRSFAKFRRRTTGGGSRCTSTRSTSERALSCRYGICWPFKLNVEARVSSAQSQPIYICMSSLIKPLRSSLVLLSAAANSRPHDTSLVLRSDSCIIITYRVALYFES